MEIPQPTFTVTTGPGILTIGDSICHTGPSGSVEAVINGTTGIVTMSGTFDVPIITESTLQDREALLSEIEKLRKEISDLRNSDGEKMSMKELKKLRLDIAELDRRVSYLRSLYDRHLTLMKAETPTKLKATIAALEDQIVDLKRRLTDSVNENAKIFEQYEVLSLAVRQNKFSVDVDVHTKAMTRINDLETLLALKEAEYAKERKSFQGQLDTSRTALSAVDAARDKAFRELEASKEKNTKTEQALRKCEASLKKAENALADTANQLVHEQVLRTTTQVQLSNCQKDLDASENRVSRLEELNKGCNAQIECLLAKNAELQKQIEAAGKLKSKLAEALQDK